MAAILREIEMQKDYLQGAEIETIYFGGGTPSLLSADEINNITELIYRHYNVKQLREFTLETNPDDLSPEYIRTLRNTQVDRFSIGIQSFREQDLKYMNRAHTAQQSDRAIKTAQDMGYTNLTIDLIYGTPGLTDDDWKYNLQQVKELGIPHFSAYALTVEEGTALYHHIRQKKARAVDNEQSAAQFEMLMEQADAMGYDHYEISNLALPGKYAVHNTNYWMGKTYLGIGPSAHSFDGKNRRWNIANNALYAKSILAEHALPYEEEHLTVTEYLNEYIMTSLRTMWGCDLDKITVMAGSDIVKQILADAAIFIENGELEYKEHKLILTNKGRLIADRIAGALFITKQ